MNETGKLPAIQFYPGDWLRDPGVQSLIYHDRGVWLQILCYMHDSSERGKLVLNGRAMTEDEMGRLLGLDRQVLAETLHHLVSSGVASRDEGTGALVSRRMVRDEETRQCRKLNPHKGGRPRKEAAVVQPLNQTETKTETPSFENQNSNLTGSFRKPPQNENSKPPSSSSVSSSKLTTEREREASPPPAAIDLQPLAVQIVLAHPRARMRNWRAPDIPLGDRLAAVAAIRSEAEALGLSPPEAGLVILESIEAIAHGVPEGEWRYLKDVAEFLRLREYRVKPEHLTRNGASHGKPAQHQPNHGPGTHVSPAEQRQRESFAAIGDAFERRYGRRPGSAHGADGGPVPEAEAASADDGHVPGGVGGDGAAVRPGPVSQRTVEGDPRPRASPVLSRTA